MPDLESGEVDPRIPAVISRLVDLMDASGGYAWDTYDTRVGRLYLALSAGRRNFIARYGLFGLYAIELMAPITYRRLRRIPKTWDPMGNSYRVGTELSLYLLDDDSRHLDRARELLRKIAARAVGNPGQRGFALGFPCITGSNKLWSTATPVAHYTMRVARKLLCWEQVTGDREFRPLLQECMQFLMHGLPWVREQGCVGVGYTPDDPLQVVNIWADVASLLAAYAGKSGDSQAAERARALFASVASHQDSRDGSFPYFARWESRRGAIDNTHTAMVLGALADALISFPDMRPSIAPVIDKGTRFWIDSFFDARTGRHWNLVDRPHDTFTVCLGDALYAFNRLLRPEVAIDPLLAARMRAIESRMTAWSIDTLRLRSGHFCERRLRLRKFCVRSIRSFDGLTADGLSLYLARKRLGEQAKLWAQ